MEKVIHTKDNHKISLEVSLPAAIPSFFVFALHKSGSVMQDKILEDICSHLQIPLISIAKSAFEQGVEEGDFDEAICDIFTSFGYGFYGFRYLPAYLNNFDLSNFKKILLIRDPRDILVSHYFSMKKSHAIPKGQIGEKLLENREKIQAMDINEYVLEKAPIFHKIITKYSRIEDNSFKLFRYEDVVFNKQQWILDILAFLDLELEDNKIEEIVNRHNIFPSTENPSSHIRRVTPGDYKEKLKTSTIDRLNNCFQDILVKYQYSMN